MRGGEPGASRAHPRRFRGPSRRALRKRYDKLANLDLRVSRDDAAQIVDEVTHKEPAAPDRFVDESATSPSGRPISHDEPHRPNP